MDRNLAAAHAAHDELLLARLYGRDLKGRELERARDLVAGCEKCAAVLADFAALAEATTALPIPARPRDFTISAAQASALRQRGRPGKRGLRAMLGRIGPVRAMGASMTAAGVAGMLVLGGLFALGPGGPTETWFRTAADPALDAAGSPGAQLDGGGEGTKNGGAVESPPGFVAGGPTVDPAALESDGPSPELGESPRAPEATGQVPAGPTSSDAQSRSETDNGAGGAPSPAHGPDIWAVWLLGFGGLLAGGLVLLMVATVRRRRSPWPRH